MLGSSCAVHGIPKQHILQLPDQLLNTHMESHPIMKQAEVCVGVCVCVCRGQQCLQLRTQEPRLDTPKIWNQTQGLTSHHEAG
ncbi:hypothetical protein Pmani_003913 [Petrolisthes manimaculis]|uniref:Uncharacterized protein n=1 Tax=Petrolisthes manimaculis TaxID=1843537 RepID=A0AAE1QHK0_9EUCA|nr:hypothetical protein Pmani_003913 [Petrolisthes manimaculis]